MNEQKGQFKCCHCGDRFDDPEAAALISDGEIYSWDVDCCEECAKMINHSVHDITDMHSDADPGL